MSSLSGVGLLTSFGAGVISFVTPCVLPLVPGYVSYVAGDALTGEAVKPLAALRLSLFFVLGFSTVFVILGRARRPSVNCSFPIVRRKIWSAGPLSCCLAPS